MYEILNERLYECVDKTTFTSPQPFNHDTSGNGSLRSNHKQSMELEKTGKYVIQPETEEENAHDGDFVIKNPDTKERDIQATPQTPQYEIPTSPISISAVTRRKNIHTLSEFSRNFKYEGVCSNSWHLNIVRKCEVILSFKLVLLFINILTVLISVIVHLFYSSYYSFGFSGIYFFFT